MHGSLHNYLGIIGLNIRKRKMSRKDENQPGLQKQMGCISGFFHLFHHRQWFLTGETSNEVKDLNNNNKAMQKAKAKNVKVAARENQQFSTESSSTTSSMSSPSCSSSMSSLEFNRTIHVEPPSSISQIKIRENSSSGAAQSLDFHDIVKDSMQRELSVKTAAKEEKKGRTLRRIDSPRPLQPLKPSTTGVTVADEPFCILTKSRKAPWDSPRHSYDGRDVQQILRCATKHKEIARFSLDSKEGSIKGFDEATKPRNLLKGAAQKGQQEPETPRRPSSVVAKLMGLEAFPDWTQTCDTPPPSMSSGITNRNEMKISNPSSFSVYGEIEKRMADLQFKNSGKDLRALKQILEAMQRYKDSLDTTEKLGECSKLQSPRIQKKDRKSVAGEMSNSTNRGSELPIVIMKPAAQVTRKANSPAFTETPVSGKSANGRLVDKLDRKTAKSTRTSKPMQSSKVPQVINGESRSPRRVQKIFGLETRSPTRQSPDSSSNRRQHKQKISKTIYKQRDFKHEVNVISSDFDGNRSMDPHSDTEAILQVNTAAKELCEESFVAETIVTAEQPSPVSVLDAAFYIEDPPSPVKKKTQISKDLDEALNAYDSSDNDFQTQNLVQTLQQIHYEDEKFSGFGESNDPDRKYISEILVASGLLGNPSSSDTVHSPGHPINPNLFLALEQIKTNKMHFRKNNPEKMHRKLVFDVVNDILLQKITLESPSTLQWCLPNQPAGRKLNRQRLLDEICRENEKLQHRSRNAGPANEDEILTSLLRGDFIHRTAANWTECDGETPNIVLDIERLIFKDLITEVVRGEVGITAKQFEK